MGVLLEEGPAGWGLQRVLGHECLELFRLGDELPPEGFRRLNVHQLARVGEGVDEL